MTASREWMGIILKQMCRYCGAEFLLSGVAQWFSQGWPQVRYSALACALGVIFAERTLMIDHQC
jgi:hypothetical protein